MVRVTADDIQVLAQTEGEGLLVLADGRVRVVSDGDEAPRGRVVYRKRDLLRDLGLEITKPEAEVLAAGLTAQLTGTRRD